MGGERSLAASASVNTGRRADTLLLRELERLPFRGIIKDLTPSDLVLPRPASSLSQTRCPWTTRQMQLALYTHSSPSPANAFSRNHGPQFRVQRK